MLIVQANKFLGITRSDFSFSYLLSVQNRVKPTTFQISMDQLLTQGAVIININRAIC